MWELAAAIAGPLISGVFGGSSPQQQKPYQFNRLVKKANEAGFNPLTALKYSGGGGGGGFSSTPVLSSADFIGEAISNAAAYYGSKEEREFEQQARQLELAQRKQELALVERQNSVVTRIGNTGFDVPTIRQAVVQQVAPKPVLTSPNSNPGTVRPKARPTIGTIDRVPVFLPDGQTRKIPAGAANRLGMKPFDYMMAGDYAELVGEARGEGESVLLMDKIGTAAGIPLWPEKPKMEQGSKVRKESRRKRSENETTEENTSPIWWPWQ